ncbi:MAG TPA: hypothetical protein VH234_02830, partial [Candidatus Saccharimonadales bacterium]|nr:hypothetical protein [Candidatus Saccharimonadales bacterium]
MKITNLFYSIVVPLIGVFLVFFLFKTTPVKAATGINQTINFQGRLLNNQGATVPDGFYNIEFKIYQDGDGQSAGDSTGSPAGSLKWTENYLNSSHGVKVVNGYLSVQLGSLTPFGSNIDWNQSVLWLSMQIGNTSACTITTSFQTDCGGDGEMTPMQPMTAAPYALNAGQLGGLSSTQFVQLAQGVQADTSTTNPSIFVNKNNSSGTPNIVELQKSGVDVMVVDNSGTALFRPASDSTTALQVKNRSSGYSVFTVDTSGSRVVLGQASSLTGKLAFATVGGGTLTINPTSSASSFTITLPAETGTVCTTAASGTCNTAGGLSNVAYLNQDQTFTGKNAFSHTGSTSNDYAVGITGTPAASSTSSLLRLGNTISAGNGGTNGGTFLSINESSSGAGSAADFLNLQNGSTVELQLTAGGNLTVNGTYNSNTFNNNTLGFGAAGAATIHSNGANNLTVDTGSTGGALTLGNNAATTNIGTSSATHAVTIGSANNDSSTLALQGGNGSAAIALLTGNNGSTAGGIQIGNITGAFNQSILIGTNNSAANTVQIGTGTGQDSVTIGNTTSASSAVAINAGSSGGITLGGNTTISGGNTFTTGSGAVSLG